MGHAPQAVPSHARPPARWHHAMDLGVMGERLPPGLPPPEQAARGAHVLGSTGHGLARLGARLPPQPLPRTRMLQRARAARCRQGKAPVA